jgi:hypothetical protein
VVGKTKPPTADEKRRLETLKEHVPCIPCLLRRLPSRLPTIQHTTSGFTRDGHASTYSACEWHHLGDHTAFGSRQAAIGALGPSLALSKRDYAIEFGPEKFLVAAADQLLSCYHEDPWPDYDVPYEVRSRLLKYHARATR